MLPTHCFARPTCSSHVVLLAEGELLEPEKSGFRISSIRNTPIGIYESCRCKIQGSQGEAALKMAVSPLLSVPLRLCGFTSGAIRRLTTGMRVQDDLDLLYAIGERFFSIGLGQKAMWVMNIADQLSSRADTQYPAWVCTPKACIDEIYVDNPVP